MQFYTDFICTARAGITKGARIYYIKLGHHLVTPRNKEMNSNLGPVQQTDLGNEVQILNHEPEFVGNYSFVYRGAFHGELVTKAQFIEKGDSNNSIGCSKGHKIDGKCRIGQTGELRFPLGKHFLTTDTESGSRDCSLGISKP